MNQEIAIVGLDCNFPAAKNPFEYWELLKSKTSGIKLTEDLHMHNQTNFVPYKGIMNDPFCFDAEFFGISPADAMIMDPQHRILIQLAYRALNATGYNFEKNSKKTGVFSSCGFPEYFHKYLLKNKEITHKYENHYLQVANDKDFLATRIAYHLNLTGPAVTVQSGCSSSLLAVHLAVQSLSLYEIDVAIAGGVSISYPINSGYHYTEGSILSPDGKVHAFDKKANGTVRGDGAGIVILKRLEDALNDNNTIFAIISASKTNNDGKNKVGFTAPSYLSQKQVLDECLEESGFNVDDIDFIEGHGTGTKLGDPIEVRAIYDVYKDKKDMLILSSVKPHIGHLDAASGIASLIKTVLCLYNKTIPHTLNFEEINPLISPYKKIINILNDPLLLEKDQIVSGVTSLGIGGTNVHVILRSYPGNNPSCLLSHLSASDIFKKTVYVTDTVEDVKLYQENSPNNSVKEIVTEAWKEILGCKDADIDLNFFDIGGTSFLAIQCLNLLNKRLNKKINLTDFYEYPTLRLFIQKIEAKE